MREGDTRDRMREMEVAVNQLNMYNPLGAFARRILRNSLRPRRFHFTCLASRKGCNRPKHKRLL